MSDLNKDSKASAPVKRQDEELSSLYQQRHDNFEDYTDNLVPRNRTLETVVSGEKAKYDSAVTAKVNAEKEITALDKAIEYHTKKEAIVEKEQQIQARDAIIRNNDSSEENKNAARESKAALEAEKKVLEEEKTAIEEKFKEDDFKPYDEYIKDENYSSTGCTNIKQSKQSELNGLSEKETAAKAKYDEAVNNKKACDEEITRNLAERTNIDNAIMDNKWESSQADIESIGLNKTSITRYSADGENESYDVINNMADANGKADSENKYFAKDISPDNDGSELSVITVKKDDKFDTTKSNLEQKGFKEVDKSTADTFKEKYDSRKTQKESNTSETGGSSVDEDNGGSSDGNSEGSENKQEANKPELGYDEKKKKLEDEGIKEYNKDAKLTIAGHNVPYVKVNGSNKIRFPKYDKVMGLPPLRIFTNDPKKPSSNIGNNTSDLFDVNMDASDSKDIRLYKEYFLYNVDEMLVNSFPILTIRPLDCENLMGTNGNITKDKKTHDDMKRNSRYNIVDNVVYKFAVTTTNNINYSHQNNFGQSSTESSGLVSSLNGMGKFTSDLVGIGQNTAGFGNNNLIGELASMGLNLGGDIDEAVRQFIAAGEEGSKGLGAVGSKMGKTVADIANLVTSVVGGGRIDFPDVWQDSQTSFQQSFTIELRSLNPDPTSDQYFYDIILPLYILLTISLPTEGNVFSYKTPPLITCSLDDSFMEILLGAVTQINWSFDTKEINFKKVPWHCQVNITIRDLYSVMSQATYTTKNEKYVKDSNREIMTKEKYFENFIRTKDKKIPNEKYYLTEFAKIPAYMNALEQRMNKEQKAADEEKMKNSVNGGDKSSSQQPEGNVSGNSGETGKDTSNAPKKEEIKTDPKTGKKTLISSIGGFVTGITKGIRNVVASVNKVITPVRQIINTGATVLNAANNVKCAIKCVGQTANLPGLLNGSFAASVGLAFENLGKAGNVLKGLSGGVLGSVTKSVGGICTTLSELGRSALVLDLPEYVSKDGKTIQLNDPFKVASSTMRATGLMVSNILNTVQGAKMIGNITKSSDPLATLTTYVNAANKIVGEVDFTDRLLNVAKGSAIETGQYTAGQLASNATIQERFRHVANTVSGQAASVASTMFNTTLAEYMMQQQWFDTYFQSTNNNADPSNPVNIKDFKYKDEIKAAIDYANGKTDSAITPEVSWNAVKDAVMDNIDGSIQDFSKGVKEFANSTHDILIKSGFSGVVNTAGTPFDVIFMDNK